MKKAVGNGTRSFGYFSVRIYFYSLLRVNVVALIPSFSFFPPLCIASQHWKALFDQVCEQLMYCLCLMSKECSPHLISSVLDFPCFYHTI